MSGLPFFITPISIDQRPIRGKFQAAAFRLCFAWRLCYSIGVNSTFRIGILGSGRGSNFAAIAKAAAAGKIPAQIAIVLSDVENAGILDLARERKSANQRGPQLRNLGLGGLIEPARRPGDAECWDSDGPG